MRVKITTTYINVDPEWLDWYLKRLDNESELPGSKEIVAKLRETGYAAYVSKDPTSKVTAQTEYEVIGRDADTGAK